MLEYGLGKTRQYVVLLVSTFLREEDEQANIFSHFPRSKWQSGKGSDQTRALSQLTPTQAPWFSHFPTFTALSPQAGTDLEEKAPLNHVFP